MIIVNYIASVVLVVLGLYVIMTKKHLIKIVLGMSIVDYGINLFIVSTGFNEGGTAPIYKMSEFFRGSFFVDPVPPGSDPDLHSHRRLRGRHGPLPGGQALQAVSHYQL